MKKVLVLAAALACTVLYIGCMCDCQTCCYEGTVDEYCGVAVPGTPKSACKESSGDCEQSCK
jgi:hypothetical protein